MTPEDRARAISAELDRWWVGDVEANPWPEETARQIAEGLAAASAAEDFQEMERLTFAISDAHVADAEAREAANADRNARWEAHRTEFVKGLDGG